MYRENISNFITEQNAKLYIPNNKGLKEYVTGLLMQIGVNPETGGIMAKGEEQGLLEIEVIKGSGIPQKVADNSEVGNPAYGLVGDDLFDEYKLLQGQRGKKQTLEVLNTYDWFDENAMFGRPALVLMNKTGTWEEIGNKANVAIRDTYLQTALAYLNDRFPCKNIDFEFDAYSTDTEFAVNENESTKNCCIEIVYSGLSIKNLGLKPVEIIRFSDISLIGPVKNPKAKNSDYVSNVFEQEFGRIVDRKKNPTESLTTKLLGNQNELVKKLGQESAEFVQALATKENLVGEALDVFYATMVGLVAADTSWEEIEATLKERW